MRDRDAEDHALLVAVAHAVVERLLGELRRGRVDAVPFRVVVHNVVRWKLAEHFGARRHDGLDEEPVASDDPCGEMEEGISLEQILRDLPHREREVLEMRYLDGCEIADIARALGTTRNAVDQALFRGRRRLRELLRA